jgi:hypothetical protein
VLARLKAPQSGTSVSFVFFSPLTNPDSEGPAPHGLISGVARGGSFLAPYSACCTVSPPPLATRAGAALAKACAMPR